MAASARRRTSDETRRLLLDVGIEMLAETGPSVGVGHIKLQTVVQRADLTTGAAYRLWPNQADYHEELAAEAILQRDPDTSDVVLEAAQSGAPLDEVIRVGADAHVSISERSIDDGRTHPTPYLTSLALRASSGGSEALRAAGSDRHAGAIEQFALMYAALLDAYGRQLREPFTIEQLTEAIAALSEGFAVQAIEGAPHPRLVAAPHGGEPREWTLFGLSILAIVDSLTEPTPDNHPGREK